MAHSRRLLYSHLGSCVLNDVTVSVANADQSMTRISSIDLTYLIALMVASGSPYHGRPNGSGSEIRSTRARGRVKKVARVRRPAVGTGSNARFRPRHIVPILTKLPLMK